MAELGILESTQLGMLSEIRARHLALAVRRQYGAGRRNEQRTAQATKLARAA
jgi:hypothetical protein